MTVAEAATEFEKHKRAIAEHEAQLEPARQRLLEYFNKSDKRDYRGRIGYSREVQRRLDTTKVKAELGDRLADFQRSVPVEKLSLLK